MHFIRITTPDGRLLEGAADSIEAIPQTIKNMLIVLRAEYPEASVANMLLTCNFGTSLKTALEMVAR